MIIGCVPVKFILGAVGPFDWLAVINRLVLIVVATKILPGSEFVNKTDLTTA
jgi:hypothetical protein